MIRSGSGRARRLGVPGRARCGRPHGRPDRERWVVARWRVRDHLFQPVRLRLARDRGRRWAARSQSGCSPRSAARP